MLSAFRDGICFLSCSKICFHIYLDPLATTANNVAMLNLSTKCICDRQMAINVLLTLDATSSCTSPIFDCCN